MANHYLFKKTVLHLFPHSIILRPCLSCWCNFSVLLWGCVESKPNHYIPPFYTQEAHPWGGTPQGSADKLNHKKSS